MKHAFKYILMIVVSFAVGCGVPVVAAEMDNIEVRLRALTKPQKLLDMVHALNLSKSATWTDVEPLMIYVSSNLGVRSISIKSNLKTVKGIVLMGSEPSGGGSNLDPNLVITAVTVRSEKGLVTYNFKNGMGYVSTATKPPAQMPPVSPPPPPTPTAPSK
jgi:hypothetical protein